MCGKTLERFSHLADCSEVRAVLVEVWRIARATYPEVAFDPGFIYLGKIDRARVLEGAFSALHIIAWKFIVIAFTQVETKGATYDSARVWSQTLSRFKSRVLAHAEGCRRRALALWSQGKEGLTASEVEKPPSAQKSKISP